VSFCILIGKTCVHVEFLVNEKLYFIPIRKSALDNDLSYRNYDLFTTPSLKESWFQVDPSTLLRCCASGRSVDLTSLVFYGDIAFFIILRPIFYSVIFFRPCLTEK